MFMPDQNNTIRVVAQLGLLVYWWRFIEQNKERLSQTRHLQGAEHQAIFVSSCIQLSFQSRASRGLMRHKGLDDRNLDVYSPTQVLMR